MPDLSICIPTYEPDLDYLAALLRSIQPAAFAMNTEVIVSDDHSSNYGETHELVERLLPTARVSQSAERLGMVGNWNRAAQAATSDYLIVPGQDDELDPHAITRLLALAQETHADLAFGDERYMTPEGQVRLDPRRGPTVDLIWSSTERETGVFVDARIGLLVGSILGDPCAALIRTSTYQRLGGFSPRYGHAADHEFWMRTSAAGGRVLLTNVPTSSRRIHDQNATASHVRNGTAATDRKTLLLEYGGCLPTALRRQAAARLQLHRTWDVLRSPGLIAQRTSSNLLRPTPRAFLVAAAVDFRSSRALRSTRRRFEEATT